MTKNDLRKSISINRAKKLAVAIPPHTPPHAANPCTMVFGLVESLLMYL